MVTHTYIKNFLCVGSCVKQGKKKNWKDAHWTRRLRLNNKKEQLPPK